ncbi:glycine zipper 2TM domain-containing protein [Polaromonas sp. YR568]|uniref:glycine zipper 2TM domain-containing protein n=1 Tax=Polaromonas sp. YR568 TaxID=1855301 RepID=UPI003137822E
MDTHTNTQVAPSPSAGQNKYLIPIIAVMGVTVLALVAALVVNSSDAKQSDTAPAAVTAKEPAKAATAPKPASNTTAKNTNGTTTSSKSVNQSAPVVAQSGNSQVCATCGTVESVVAVERQGQVNGVAVGGTTIGLGTVAGGVVGGLLGNQMGGGDGKTAMTVLGVAGGAVAGNAIEKNMKKVTVYQVRVRMNDGSVRTIEQPTAVQVGAKVVVEGNTLRAA